MRSDFKFSIQWHITSKCLNKCKHCYMYNDDYVQETMSLSDFKAILENINNFEKKYEVEIKHYALTGGSALLHPNCKEMIDFLMDKGKKVFLMDIPEMLTDENLRYLKDREISQVQLSLDGLPETHDSIRGRGSFERTIEGYKKLNESDIQASIMYTVSKNNADDLFPLIDYLLEHVRKFNFAYDFVVCEGNAKENNLALDREKALILMRKYLEYVINVNGHYDDAFLILKPSPYHMLNYYQNDTPMTFSNEYSMVSGCHVGWRSISILPNGDALPCRRMPISLGNLLSESFEDLLLGSELMRHFRHYESSMDQCGSCQYAKACRGCPADSYGRSGDPFGRYAYCFCDEKPRNNSFRDVSYLNNSYAEEFDLIMKTMDNQIANNLPDLLKTGKMLQAWKDIGVNSSKEEQAQFTYAYPEWDKTHHTNLDLDQKYLLSLLLAKE